MFLLYIHDIDQNISSTIRLFADDCIMYRTVTTREEASILQCDLNKIYDWCTMWQMQLNIDKCAILRCTRSHSPVLFDYVVDGKTITSTSPFTRQCNGHIILMVSVKRHPRSSILFGGT